MQKVRKRNGSLAEYDSKKIFDAIKKANKDSKDKRMNNSSIWRLVSEVEEYFEDVKVINELKKRLQAKGLVTPEKLQEQRKKISAAEAKLRGFESKADLMNREMETYGYFNEYVKVLGKEYEMKKEEGKSKDENQRNVPKQIL